MCVLTQAHRRTYTFYYTSVEQAITFDRSNDLLLHFKILGLKNCFALLTIIISMFCKMEIKRFYLTATKYCGKSRDT